MIPSFGTLFGEPISPYFTFVAVAFLVCTWISVRWAKQMRLDHEVLIDLALISVITGVAGARIAHVLFDGYFMDYVHMCTDPSQVGWQITREECQSQWVDGLWDSAANVCRPKESDCFAWARFWAGGLTWYGGMFLAVGYAMYFLKKENFPRLKALDLGGLMLPVGLFFGRLGCFFGGCCFGAVTDSRFGLVFPAWSAASEQQWKHHLLSHPSLPSLPVYPTQLLEAGGSLLLAFIAFLYWHPRKRYDGQVFVWSMGGYAVLRFFLEYLRDDDRGGFFRWSTSQWLSVLLLVFLTAMAWRLRRSTAPATPSLPTPLEQLTMNDSANPTGSTTNTAQSLADGCVRMVFSKLGIELDYSAETLPLLDHYLTLARKDALQAQKDADKQTSLLDLLATPAGAYFGEVIARTLDARFVVRGSESLSWRIEFPHVCLFFSPVGMVLELLLEREEPGSQAHFEVLPKDEGKLHDALGKLGPIEDERYFLLTARYEVLLEVLAVLERGSEPGTERFSPEVYAALAAERFSDLPS